MTDETLENHTDTDIQLTQKVFYYFYAHMGIVYKNAASTRRNNQMNRTYHAIAAMKKHNHFIIKIFI